MTLVKESNGWVIKGSQTERWDSRPIAICSSKSNGQACRLSDCWLLLIQSATTLIHLHCYVKHIEYGNCINYPMIVMIFRCLLLLLLAAAVAVVVAVGVLHITNDWLIHANDCSSHNMNEQTRCRTLSIPNDSFIRLFCMKNQQLFY